MRKIRTNKALLVIDLQNQTLPNRLFGIPTAFEVIENSRQVIEASREEGVPIIYTRHVYRANGIDKALGEPSEYGVPLAYREGTPEVEIPDRIKPEPGDIVIDKRRWSAFFGTDLEIVLHRMGIEELVVCGVVTDGCVMTTVYDAFFRDYRVSLVKDACGASNPAVHMAAILNMANWVYGLKVFTTEEMVKNIHGHQCSCWESPGPNTRVFEASNLGDLYQTLE